MAKGNLLLGYGRGSIGDVTLYRSNGQQQSRARNRNPKNPRTNAQLIQRAVMATVMRAYQVGKVIFDHSFEGLSKGAESQRRFMSLNLKALRSKVMTDINPDSASETEQSRVVAPSTSSTVANSYIISQGTYNQNLFSWSSSAQGYLLPDREEPTPEDVNFERVGHYVQRLGLKANDLYTFVVFAERTDVEYQYQSELLDARNWLRFCDFVFVRMRVRDNLDGETAVLNTLGQLFDIEVGGTVHVDTDTIAAYQVNSAVTIDAMVYDVEEADDVRWTNTGAIGCIRSRVDSDLRSTSSMILVPGSDNDTRFGITADWLLDVWSSNASAAGSDLILEGGDI